ncbi:vitamin K epoxide reductase family protein [Jongsikchunia kroppenstedtii]|uniref:vitamin K epoxide reductase family protein n=1 Tax=Jongsikchunia kroppenstedtii TaxID=1121721 RepID=UPI00037A4C22
MADVTTADDSVPSTDPSDVTTQAIADEAPEEPTEIDADDLVSSRGEMIRSAAIFILGIVGLVAAATLSIEKFKQLTEPGYSPSCSINPILSCGSVMSQPQAEFFGFPNPYIGIGAYVVPIMLGALALSRVQIPRWFWAGLAAGALVGMVFIHYLITESLYVIHALCPYCMVVWTITPAIMVLAIQKAVAGKQRLAMWAGWLWPLLIVWYFVIIGLITHEFWYYWKTLL